MNKFFKEGLEEIIAHKMGTLKLKSEVIEIPKPSGEENTGSPLSRGRRKKVANSLPKHLPASKGPHDSSQKNS